jgi:putative oxidoreductase
MTPSNPDLALLLLRIGVGAFFFCAGYQKCLTPAGRKRVFGIFQKYHVTTPMGWAVIIGQFLGGIAMLLGFMTQVAAFGLVIIMIGAYEMAAVPEARAKNPKGLTDTITTYLSNSEALLLLSTIVLTFSGAGAYSLDALIWG